MAGRYGFMKYAHAIGIRDYHMKKSIAERTRNLQRKIHIREYKMQGNITYYIRMQSTKKQYLTMYICQQIFYEGADSVQNWTKKQVMATCLLSTPRFKHLT